MSGSLTPEFTLLVEAAAPAERAPRDRSAWRRADWERALKAARWHRLEPMLARHLAHDERTPQDVRARLQPHYLANAARQAFVGAALRDALEHLRAAGVEAMLLKGAALTAGVYPDAAVREMLDVDVLVRPGRLDAANATLAALGYKPPPGAGEEQHSAGWMRANHHHDPALVAADGLLAIELHHHIAMKDERRGAFDAADLWERSREHPTVPGHRLPAPEDLLLHVGFHFTRNRLGGSHIRSGSGGALSQLADLAWIVAREPLEWDLLATIARGYGLDTRLFLALFAAHEVGFEIPSEGLDALRPARFDPRVGRRLVGLRVLRSGRKLPVRSLRWMAAPPRDVLVRGYAADPHASHSLARAYLRRIRTHAPLARAAFARPWSVVQDYRLNGQIHALEHRE